MLPFSVLYIFFLSLFFFLSFFLSFFLYLFIDFQLFSTVFHIFFSLSLSLSLSFYFIGCIQIVYLPPSAHLPPPTSHHLCCLSLHFLISCGLDSVAFPSPDASGFFNSSYSCNNLLLLLLLLLPHHMIISLLLPLISLISFIGCIKVPRSFICVQLITSHY